MALLRRYLTALAAGLLFQAAGAAQPPTPATRQIQFTVFSAQPIANLVYVPRPEARAEPVAFYPTARSPRYCYAGPATMQFLDATSGAVTAEVTVPADMPNPLFIFSPVAPAPGRTLRFRVRVVDDGEPGHPLGTLMILNDSGLELKGFINGRPVPLHAGMNGPIWVGPAANITLRTPFKDRTFPVYRETLELDQTGRALLLLLAPYRTGSLEVQSRVLLDTPEPETRERVD